MKNIVIVNDLITGGGVENVLYNLVQYLMKLDYNITIIALRATEEEFKKVYSSDVKFISLKKYDKVYKRFTLTWFLNHICRLFIHLYFSIKKYDIAIGIKEGESAKFASIFNAKRKIAWVHVDYSRLYWTKGVYGSEENEKKCMQKFDSVICVSEAARKSFCDVIGDTGNLQVRYNPLDVCKILSEAEKETESDLINMRKQSPVLVSVGRLSPLKRYDKLLECCLRLRDRYDFQIWLIGDGPERKKLELFIKEHNLTNVTLWGEQQNPYPFIKQADWFISTSETESYGLALQEAMVIGTPVIATKCPAIVECVPEDKSILVENDFDELIHKLEMVLDNPMLQKDYKTKLEQNNNYEKLYLRRLEEIEELWLVRK